MKKMGNITDRVVNVGGFAEPQRELIEFHRTYAFLNMGKRADRNTEKTGMPSPFCFQSPTNRLECAPMEVIGKTRKSLKTTRTDIIARLRQGRFPNEQAITQGIVLRVLQELGWDIYDTTAVWPEFQTGESRADFALCHRPSKPADFIEVKPPGKAEVGVHQALKHAFHTGVPFIVLTDGRIWSFYLPAEQGSYGDRRVYMLDLFERPPTEAAETLYRYLARAHVKNGEDLEAARKEYRSGNRRTQACAAIPEAWRELVEKRNEGLVDMLANTAESKAGVRPGDNDVAAFLAGLGRPLIVETTCEKAAPQASPAPHGPIVPRTSAETTRNGKLMLRSKAYPYHNAKDAMVIVLREVAKGEPTFLERCYQHPDAQGRKPEELYPDRPDLREFREDLPAAGSSRQTLSTCSRKPSSNWPPKLPG